MILRAQRSTQAFLVSPALCLAALSLTLGLSACQVPGDKLKPPPVFSATASQPERSGPAEAYRPPAEELAIPTASLTDFLKAAGSDVILFAPRSAQLSDAAKATLDRQAAWLAARPTVAVLIEGHSDERVSIPQAFALAEQRATAVRRYFVAGGLAPERIRIIPYGKTMPAAVGHDEAAWQSNRRVRVTPLL